MCGRDWSSDVCSSDLVIDKILIVGQALGMPDKADALARSVSDNLQAALEIGRASCRERV